MLEVKNLRKEFGNLVAVKGVTFSSSRGEVLGLLGPNGAGKSTTMRMILNFLRCTSGDALVNGQSVHSNPVKLREKVGYLPENAPLYDEMLVEEFLDFMAEMRNVPKDKRLEAVEKVLGLCAINDVRRRPIEVLSKGYKRRVSMAQALIHDPDLLILDEPTDGLDPNQKFEVRNLIKKLSKDKCILLSTHILEEVEAVCTRTIIISEGEIRFDGTPEELKQKSSKGKIDDVFRAITTGESVSGVTL